MAGAVRDTLNQLQKLFRIRNCRDSFFANRSRPCCQPPDRPLLGTVRRSHHARRLRRGHGGGGQGARCRSDEVNAELQARMEEAGASLQFERAAQIRDQLAALKRSRHSRS